MMIIDLTTLSNRIHINKFCLTVFANYLTERICVIQKLAEGLGKGDKALDHDVCLKFLKVSMCKKHCVTCLEILYKIFVLSFHL